MILRYTFDAICLVAASAGVFRTHASLDSRSGCSTEQIERTGNGEWLNVPGYRPDYAEPMMQGEEKVRHLVSHLRRRRAHPEGSDTLRAQHPPLSNDSAVIRPGQPSTNQAAKHRDLPGFAFAIVAGEPSTLVRREEETEVPPPGQASTGEMLSGQSRSGPRGRGRQGASRAGLVACMHREPHEGGHENTRELGVKLLPFGPSSSVCSTRPTTTEDASRGSGNLFVSDGAAAATVWSSSRPSNPDTTIPSLAQLKISMPSSAGDPRPASPGAGPLPNGDGQPALAHSEEFHTQYDRVGSPHMKHGTGRTSDRKHVSDSHGGALERHASYGPELKASPAIGATTSMMPAGDPAPEAPTASPDGIQVPDADALPCSAYPRGTSSQVPNSRVPQKASTHDEESTGESPGQFTEQFLRALSASERGTCANRQSPPVEPPVQAGEAVLQSTSIEQGNTSRPHSGTRLWPRNLAARTEEAEPDRCLPESEEVGGSVGLMPCPSSLPAGFAETKTSGVWGGEGRGERMEWKIDNFLEVSRTTGGSAPSTAFVRKRKASRQSSVGVLNTV